MNKFKKVLSFVLAIALVVAFVPAGIVDNAEAAFTNWAENSDGYTKMYYYLPRLWAGTNAVLFDSFEKMNSLGTDKYPIGEDYPTGVVRAAQTGNGDLYISAAARGGVSGAVQIDANRRARVYGSTTSGYIAVVIKLPTVKGRYALNLYEMFYGANSIDCWVTPEGVSVSEGMTDEYYLGSSVIETSVSSYAYPCFGYIDVTDENAGTNLQVIISPTEGSTGGNSSTTGSSLHEILFYGLQLDGAAVSGGFSEVSISGVPSNGYIYESGKLSATTYDAEGNVIDIPVTYSSSDSSIAEIDSTTGVVTVVGHGNVKFTATATLDGVTHKAVTEAYCYQEWSNEVETYDLRTVYTGDSADSRVVIGTLTDYGTNNANWYDSESVGVYGTTGTGRAGKYCLNLALWATNSPSGVYALTVKLPETPGKYLLSASLWSYSNLSSAIENGGTDINVYLWPKNASTTGNVANLMNDSYLLNNTLRTADYENNVVGKAKIDRYNFSEYDLAVIDVTPEMAGKEYILGLNSKTFKQAATGWVASYGFGINKITLNGAGSEVLQSVSLTDSDTMIETGSTEQLNLSATLSDGSSLDISKATVSYESDNADFTVSETGVVTAGIGEATITATVAYGDIIKTASTVVFGGSENTYPGADSTVVYNFAATRFGTSTYRYYPTDATETDYNAGMSVAAGLKCFKFHSMSSKVSNWYNQGATSSNYPGLTRFNATALNQWVAVTMKLPETPGLYNAQFNYYIASGGAPYAALYILDADTTDVATAIESASPVGTATLIHDNMNNLATWIEAPVSFGTYKVTAADAGKEKIFVIQAQGQGISSGVSQYSLQFRGITLNGDEASLAEDTYDIVVGDFTTTYQSGFYGESNKIADADKKGVIAFESVFEKYAEYADQIDGYGMYLYYTGTNAAGNKGNSAPGTRRITLNFGSLEDLATAEGAFNAIINEIGFDDFNTTFIAMPYVVIEGVAYYGSIVSGTVDGDVYFSNYTAE